jgi:hypothetical protein
MGGESWGKGNWEVVRLSSSFISDWRMLVSLAYLPIAYNKLRVGMGGGSCNKGN